MESPEPDTQPESPLQDRPLIEVGWIIAGKLDPTDSDAVHRANETVCAYLQETFPAFIWKMPILIRDELTHSLREEPVILLDHAVLERNFRQWDYVLVVTGADLQSYYKSDALAVISRSLEAAVISTSRIDPRSIARDIQDKERIEALARRIHVLAMHSLGHLAGLDHEKEPENYLSDFQTIEDLDQAQELTAEQKEDLECEIRRTSDRRLEEEPAQRRPGRLTFYPRAAWLNRRQILDAIIDSKPWQFPFRLSRLTAASVSAMLILLVTAEAWDLAMTQSGPDVIVLSLSVVLLATVYVIRRQRLLVRRERSRLSEQTVVTNVSTFAIVLLGMVTTYLLLMGTTMLLSQLLFSRGLIRSWAASVDGEIVLTHYLILAGFVASLGLGIGSLGVSFEERSYFRHVTLVDEET